MMHLCPNCENPFQGRASQKFCSDECRMSYHNGKGDRHNRTKAFDRRFVAWDGEGEEGRYTLLANSEGNYIERRSGLKTVECLDFLLSGPQGVNNVWYSFGYDVNMMLHNLPLAAKEHSLKELAETNATTWKGYRIRYIPNKSFAVSKGDKRDGDYRSFNSYDVFGFFQSSFIKAIGEWLKTIPDVITEGKAARSQFSSWAMHKIIAYNSEECRLLVSLMDNFRDALRAANLPVSRWDGAGAIAAAWLQRENALAYYPPELPADLLNAIHTAYFGGRIEMAGWGYARKLWHYDINSAYPSALAECPDMSELDWRHSTGGTPETVLASPDFSLWRVKWDVPASALHGPAQWCPFPWRGRRGGILYPYQGEGWYWGVEVKAALRRIKGPWLEVLEGYVPDGTLRYPLRESVHRDYAHRAALKKAGNPAHIPVKLGLNSCYGKLAQKIGMGKKIPRFRNLAWAGYITARTRALLSDGIGAADGNVVMVMTDGLWALQKADLPISSNLGEWTYESHDTQGVFAGAGLYQVWDEDGNRTESKQRGFGEADVDYISLIRQWEGKSPRATGSLARLQGARSYLSGSPPDSFTLSRFVGMRLAIVAKKTYRPQFLKFAAMTRRINSVAEEGTTKRLPDILGATVRNGLHWQVPRPRSEPCISFAYVPGKAEEEIPDVEKEERLAEECGD